MRVKELINILKDFKSESKVKISDQTPAPLGCEIEEIIQIYEHDNKSIVFIKIKNNIK